MSSPGSNIGTGGMITKLVAAELASSAGCSTVITLGSHPSGIIDILQDIIKNGSQPDFEPKNGTLFIAKGRVLEDRKWWIAHGLAISGTLIVDEGAAKAIFSKGSLFAAGIVDCLGTFTPDQSVLIKKRVKMENGEFKIMEIAKGIVRYSSAEIQRIKGRKSTEIEQILGYLESEEVIHRGDLSLLIDN